MMLWHLLEKAQVRTQREARREQANRRRAAKRAISKARRDPFR
jgi:hypothetical protein